MYLLTGRINQDCLENLFSQVRCKGGHRFNPSAREFAFAYRSLTTSMLINPIPSANCIDDQDDLIVSLSDLSKTSTNDARVRKRRNEEGGQGEIPAKQARQSETEPLVVDVIYDFKLSVTVVNVVAYVAGYIIRRIQLQTKCLECLGELSDTSLVVPESKLLIHFKAYQHNDTSSSGSLYSSSENFTNFLLRVEKVFQRNIARCMCAKGVLSTLMESAEDTVPSTALKLCPMHKGCEFTKSITQLYVRCIIDYYFKFESRQLVAGKPKKKSQKAQILMHQ